MFETLKTQKLQKNQLIKDIKKAQPKERFRGLPIINTVESVVYRECQKLCPTGAICDNYKIDLGKCTMCGECQRYSESVNSDAIKFSTFHKISATEREKLFVNGEISPIKAREEITKIFGRSLKLRQVSAGGCNSCEMELNACSNANFDMGRYGVEFVASPRHADGIVITGPVTKNMSKALEDTFFACPAPRIVIVVGACAISGGIFQGSEELDRSFFERHKPDLYIPGCPAHPLTIINGIIEFLGR